MFQAALRAASPCQGHGEVSEMMPFQRRQASQDVYLSMLQASSVAMPPLTGHWRWQGKACKTHELQLHPTIARRQPMQ